MEPDLIDLACVWFKEHYPTLNLEVITGQCSYEKIVIVHQRDPKNPDLQKIEGWTPSERADAWERNYLFTLAKNGICWRHYICSSEKDINIKLDAADPNFFENLDNLVKRILKDEN